LPLKSRDWSEEIRRRNTLIRHYLHLNPDTLSDKEWALRWEETVFLIQFLGGKSN